MIQFLIRQQCMVAASLASFAPPDTFYKITKKMKIGLSILLKETITLALQKLEQILSDGSCAGFFIGDVTGVGKGRMIAGIIFENYRRNRKEAIWISVSSDLESAARRDLVNIGGDKIHVHALKKMDYSYKISDIPNGSIKKGVIFSTYACLIGESKSSEKYQTRMEQLLTWCGEDFDGIIVFDECHQAKNCVPIGSMEPTKTGLAVLELQGKLPKARILYVSATGASEPRHLGYMVRLGLWGHGTKFKEFPQFIGAVERSGVGAMEMVAIEMYRGLYIARQLSYKNVTFEVIKVALSPKFITSYDDSVKLWVQFFHFFSSKRNNESLFN